MIKSELYKGLIDPGTTPFSAVLDWDIDANTLSYSGRVVDVQGNEFLLDGAIALDDGNWVLGLGWNAEHQAEVRAIACNCEMGEDYRLITLLAGFGGGITVVDGAIASDVYVLSTVPLED